MLKTINNLIKAILAGFAIALAGAVYLSIDNIIVGAMMFSIGLLTIYLFGWNLFTGKSCYLFDKEVGGLPLIIISLIGNFIGVFAFGWLLRLSGLPIVDKAVDLVNYKLDYQLYEVFILAVLCGIIMSIAVLGYGKQKSDAGRAIIVILPVTVFILAKFEHSIADLVYISVANIWNVDVLWFILVCALGNLVGCNVIPLSTMLTNSISKKIK